MDAAPQYVEALRTWEYLRKCGPGSARSDAWDEADKRLADAVERLERES